MFITPAWDAFLANVSSDNIRMPFSAAATVDLDIYCIRDIYCISDDNNRTIKNSDPWPPDHDTVLWFPPECG